MHLLGLGNKFGLRIINTTKTPDKEPAFSFINGNQHKFRLFRFLNWLLIKYIVAKSI